MDGPTERATTVIQYSAAAFSFSPCKGYEVTAIAKDVFDPVFGRYGTFR